MDDKRGQPPFAAIEDLDPEPANRRAPRWEVVIGLLLVLGLTGFGGWQWWDQQTKLAQYNAGVAAAAAENWDAADTAFAAASGYADAAARAADAARRATQVNTAYPAATRAAQQGNWPAALQAIRQVQEVAPHYQDTAHLAAEAQQQVYLAALSGTVAVRPQADPPGLYRYGASGWRRLQGSDAQSQIHAVCPDGRLVFDAPGGEGAPDLRLRAFPFATTGRRLLLAAPDGSPAPGGPLVFSPATVEYACTASGVWAIRETPDPFYGDALAGFNGLHWLFQAFGSAQPAMPVPPGPTWAISSGAPDGQHVLLLDGSGMTGGQHLTQFYLANLDGSDRQLLDARPGVSDLNDYRRGSLATGFFSPDSRFVVFSVNELTTTTVLLRDLSSAQPAWTLVTAQAATPGTYAGSISSTFLRTAPRAGQILLSWRDGTARRLRVLDPAHPATALLDVALPRELATLRLLSEDGQGGLVLVGTLDSADSPPVALIYLDPAQHIHRFDLTPGTAVQAAVVRAGRLVYTVIENRFDGAAIEDDYHVRSVSLGDMDLGTARSVEVYSGTVELPNRSLDRAALPLPPLRLGPGVLAYTTARGDLRARTYDGAVDLLLETQVTALYNATPGDPPFDLP